MDPADAHCKTSIEGFLEATETVLAAYRHATLKFVSFVHEGYEAVLRGRLALSVEPPKNSVPSVEACGLRVKQLSFPLDVHKLREFIAQVLEEHLIVAGDHALRFPQDHLRACSGQYENADIVYRRTRQVEERLVLTGANAWPMLNPELRSLERNLRAQGFESLNELLAECDFGRLDIRGECTFEVAAGPVAGLEATSVIRGNEGILEVKLTGGLVKEAFQVTLRNATREEEVFRQTVPGSAFSWKDVGGYVVGRASVTLPRNVRFLCQAFYTGRFQDQCVLSDPETIANPRRLVVELNDPGLANLTKVLTQIGERDDKLRNEFESAVAVLFHLLGFDAVRIGGSRRVTDGPDIYARAGNQILVIECTSGAFSDEKCAKLVTRVNALAEAWSGAYAGLQPVQIAGIVVTARRRDELAAQLTIERHNRVLVLCREEVTEAIANTACHPAPETILAAWRERPLMDMLGGGLPAGEF